VNGEVERDVRDSYGNAAASWAAGPARVYGLLADALIACIPGELAGTRALDLGAGTGVAAAALQRAGARVVAADAAYGMLRHDAAARPPAVCSDAAALPFRSDSLDHVVGAFVLNHVPDPVTTLTEAERVLRAGGAVVASTFPTVRSHPAKDAINAVIEAAGYAPPEWYATFKAEREPRSGSVDALRSVAVAAGLTGVVVHDLDVDISAVGAGGLADYRLGLAHIRPFIDSLDQPRRAEVREAAVAAAAPSLPVPMPMLALVASVQG
jgi:SAM-dependent methyltransferase